MKQHIKTSKTVKLPTGKDLDIAFHHGQCAPIAMGRSFSVEAKAVSIQPEKCARRRGRPPA